MWVANRVGIPFIMDVNANPTCYKTNTLSCRFGKKKFYNFLNFCHFKFFYQLQTKLNTELNPWIDGVVAEASTKMMIFGLVNDYDPDTHSFSTLVGEDQTLASLLCSLPKAMVQLARIERKVIVRPKLENSQLAICNSSHDENIHEEDPMEEVHIAHSITHLIDVNNFPGQFHELEKVEHQFVGSISKKKPDRVVNDHPNSGVCNIFYQSALLMWPKKVSFYIDIRHRFDYLLDRLERGIAGDPLTILNCLISCLDWKRTDVRILRLLHLCLSIHAKEGALYLLHELAVQSIGIPSDDAAVLISELECKLIGWADCEESIRLLLACKPQEQLKHFATLAQALLHRRCIPGFIYVSSETWYLCMDYANVPTDSIFTHDTLISCIEMFVTLEDHLKLTEPARLNQIVSYFSQWPIFQQCQVIIDLKSIFRRCTVGNSLYLRFCNHLADSFLKSRCNEQVVDILVDLFRCFLQLKEQVLQFLVNSVLQSKHIYCEGSNCYLKQLVASLQTLNLPSNIAIQILEARIAELNSIPQPKFTWQQKRVAFPEADKYPRVVAFLQSDESEFVVSEFSGIKEARDFCTRNFSVMEDCVERGYSAVVQVSGKGKTSRCKITKTRDLHEVFVRQYSTTEEELNRLQQQLHILTSKAYVDTVDEAMSEQSWDADDSSSEKETGNISKAVAKKRKREGTSN